jgi:hypothetical protein
VEILLVVVFYGLVFAGILFLRRLAWADLDQWRAHRR